MARAAETRAARLSPSELAAIAWAFANAGVLDARLFAALATAVEPRLEDLSEEDLESMPRLASPPPRAHC